MTDHKGLTLRNGVWLAYWQFQGKRMYKSTGETDLEKAIKKREEIIKPYMLKDEQDTIDYFIGKRTRIEKTLEEIENKKPGVLLKDVWETYLNSDLRHFPCKQVLNHYKCMLDKLINFANEKYPKITELREITTDIAKEFCLTISSANSTYNQYIIFFKHLFNSIRKQAKLNENIWDYIPKKKVKTHSRRELTAEELKKILDNAEGDMKTLFYLGIYTGLRVGDCATIKWENIDLKNDMITITPRKTRNSSNKRVHMPIHADLKSILSNLNNNQTGYVLPEVAKMYLKTNGVKLCRIITRIFKKCGIETKVEVEGNKNKAVDVGFHSLRHTFVSICANSGVPMAIVQALVGHTNPAMTEHYFHENTVALKQAIKSLPKVGETKVDKSVILDKFKAVCQEIADNGLLNEALEILKNTQPKVIEKETETDISLLQK